ncbi:SigE family RNA polymerase sigma factor [Micromonospora sp. NBC_01796]|uniref:SigE family RNA polymerase sigma factor n=1 Tax=Micromonospora sp. NBC_01796 TaxID=2975987 RepID=UPI002DDC62BA|nr:SigE family RNA polymerase sigma factor [Micromonospora sp. NBC_01796]WSA84481.1 SigE family RNA polymerase sigma factor [Micromonospora sp. NBC_01796]
MSDDGFREFVEVRYGDLLRTAYLLTGSRDAAQDLLQNALVVTMRRWRQVDEPMAYVRRVMVNERTSLWRRLGSRELLTAIVPQREQPDGTDRLAERDQLLTALRRLPARMRAVLVLRYWEELSEMETAQLLGCSVGTVKSQASRGLARLRDVLGESGDSQVPSKVTVGGIA